MEKLQAQTEKAELFKSILATTIEAMYNLFVTIMEEDNIPKAWAWA